MTRTRASGSASTSTDAAERGVVLITGASSGIGRACALRLDRLGFRVVAGIRAPPRATRCGAEAQARLTTALLDITDAAAVRRAADALASVVQVAARRGDPGLAGLAGLVNNAGITVPGPLELLPLDEVRRQLEVNVVGQLAVTQAVLPLLRAGRGRVVNVSSRSGRVALPFYRAYAASKFALEALTDALRVELRPWRIRVMVVEPGAVAPPIWDHAFAALDAWTAPPAPTGARAARHALRPGAGRGAAQRAAAGQAGRAAGGRRGGGGTGAHGQTAAGALPRGGDSLTRAVRLLDRLPVRRRDALVAGTLPRSPRTLDGGRL